MSKNDNVNVALMFLVAIVLTIVVSVAAWGFSVVWSGPQGRGDQIIKNNSEVNRTGKQEMFEQLYSNIKGYPVKISTAAEGFDMSDPAQAERARTVTVGLKNSCVNAVSEYNAEARSVLSQDWKSPDLPQKIDPADFCE